ncbi:hypothetical protein M514_00063 [Trichuris suis]|uniref:Uncharacterized protein n=1 Tax=Trichuris suis TaxID=68888 RepID=A0A085MNV4_9BILA|nr:hypothetical protein M513_00063 [Trichuris suis]KFD72926.1 hypothetical protein M514_00063 [Trichuris suis]
MAKERPNEQNLRNFVGDLKQTFLYVMRTPDPCACTTIKLLLRVLDENDVEWIESCPNCTMQYFRYLFTHDPNSAYTLLIPLCLCVKEKCQRKKNTHDINGPAKHGKHEKLRIGKFERKIQERGCNNVLF